jgi:uncharacterized protein (TIGR03118 family)
MARRIPALLATGALLAVAATPTLAANVNSQNAYVVTNLQSDVPGLAQNTDSDLVNGWGIVAGPTTPWWVADNGTSRSTLYNGATGAKVPTVIVDIAGRGGARSGLPTGIVFNGVATDFVITGSAGATSNARFIFDSLDGTVSAWNGGPASVITYTSDHDSVYTGLAIGTVGDDQFLYAADFANGHVDVLDRTFTLQDWGDAFTDPNLPADYAPFGIQVLNGEVYIAYALRGEDGDEVHGAGLGIVSAFGTDGSFDGRVAIGGPLNAPWGLAWAPAGWERFGDHLLVGNFGDGRINAYRATGSGWEDRGHLKDANHHPLVIDGLWGIGFGNGAAGGPATSLYFAAGPDDETHGLFGSITAAP